MIEENIIKTYGMFRVCNTLINCDILKTNIDVMNFHESPLKTLSDITVLELLKERLPLCDCCSNALEESNLDCGLCGECE